MNSARATILLAGSALIGGIAIGKAAMDHLALPQGERATFKGKPTLGKSPISWGIAIIGAGYVIYQTPALLREWYGYAEEYL